MTRLVVIVALALALLALGGERALADAETPAALEFLGLDPVWVQPFGSGEDGYAALVGSFAGPVKPPGEDAAPLEAAVVGTLSRVQLDVIVVRGNAHLGASIPFEAATMGLPVRVGVGYVPEGWALTLRADIGLGG